ncbi:MAG TPA: hypothetical protein VJY15_25015 [Candidatus Acidoferrum sp.]|nr:hypothetical protein [Candidatus Acidoferrum sp.]
MAKRKAQATQKPRLRSPGRRYPGVQGKVVDYISHSIDDGTLCVNVCFNDKTLFSLRFACDISIVSADLSDWKTGDYEMIREYMKPIPR